MRKPQIMMNNTSQKWEHTGIPVRAHSYFGNTSGIHTVSVHYFNFIGGFSLQGTLVLNPTEKDWFDIYLNGYNCSCNGTIIKYPKDNFSPTGQNMGDSGVDAFTFIGNFTFLRARLVRSYLGDGPGGFNGINDYGAIDKVILSL